MYAQEKLYFVERTFLTSQKTKRSPSVIWNGCFLSLHIFMTQLTQTSWDSLQFAVSEEVNSPASHVFAVWRHYSAVTLTMIDVRQRHPKERASHHWLSIHLKDKPTEACFKNSSLSSLEKQKELWWFQSKVGNLHPFISLTKTSLTKPTHVLPSSQKQEEKKITWEASDTPNIQRQVQRDRSPLYHRQTWVISQNVNTKRRSVLGCGKSRGK